MPDATPTTPRWTDAQLAAIHSLGRNTLVAAAAGSGKTATLAERVSHAVCNPAGRCAISQVLVVTFTNAAAAEMRTRIAAALQRRAPDDPHAARQALLVGQAPIGTFHGFCARLIREHFQAAGVDPAFTLLDESEAALLRRDAATHAIEAGFNGPAAAAHAALIDWYANGNPAGLEPILLRLDALLASLPDPAAWAQQALTRLESAAADPRSSTLARDFLTLCQSGLAHLHALVESTARSITPEPAAYHGYIERELLPLLDQWVSQLASSDPFTLATPELPRLPSRPKGAEHWIPWKDRMDALKEAFAQGPQSGIWPDADYWSSSLAAALPHVRQLLSLHAAYVAEARRLKAARAALDFADLERTALHLLRAPDGHPTPIARQLRARHRHVLVDESQDINALQDELLRLIAPPGELFLVGDVKQSIYRFRLADPAVFDARRRSYEASPALGHVLPLAENFRSRPAILDFINALFAQLFLGGQTEIHYTDLHRLLPSPLPYPPATFAVAPPAELYLLPPAHPPADADREAEDEEPDAPPPDDFEAIEREAACCVHLIRQLFARHATIYDKSLGQARPLRHADIAILFRARAGKVHPFAAILRRAGLPVHAEAREGLLDAQEARDLLALLHLIDNPRRDLDLITYLRSPLAAIAQPEEMLAQARLAHPQPTPLHDAIHQYAPQHPPLAAALNRIDAFRAIARRRPAAELLRDILTATHYDLYVAGLPDGLQRQANIDALLDLARAHDASPDGDLAAFLDALADLVELAASPAQSPAPPPGDATQILTIHAAKGLEFPIIIVPDLAKRFNLQDLNASILLSKDTFLSPKAPDPDKHLLYPTPAWLLARARLRPQLIAEELRTLYVALTRAREHIFLIASPGKPPTLDDDTPPPTELDVLAAQTPLDWLLAAKTRLGDLLHIHPITTPQVTTWLDQATGRNAQPIPPEILARQPLPGASPGPVLAARLAWTYPHPAAAARRAAISVTTLTHHLPDAPPASPAPSSASLSDLPLPRLLANRTLELSPTDRGTATHLALELLDFTADCSDPALHAQLVDLVRRELLTPRELAAIDLASIRWLLDSELGPHLRGQAGDLHRELPIYLPDDPALGPDAQMIRGRIDLLVQTPAGPLIIDYKTDAVSGPALEARVALYAGQVAFYKRAAEAITAQPCQGVYLAFIAPSARTVRKL